MIRIRRIGLWLLVSVSGLLPSGVSAAPAVDAFLVLSTPALISTKAVSSAMLAVTRAGERLVAVGERGIVLLSDDHGRNWQQASTPVSVALTAVQFVSPSKGWAVGHFGVVLHTTDGGKTWAVQLDGKVVADLAMQAAQKQIAQKHPDGEKALREAKYLVAEGPDKPFLDLYFLNENTGFVIGAYNLIFRTDDGGKTWVSWQQYVDNPTGMHLYGIRGVGDAIYIAGEQGLLLKANENGDHFQTIEASPYEGSYFGLIADGAGNLFVYGLRGNTFGSTDHGASWGETGIQSQVSIGAAAKLKDGGVALVSQVGQIFVGSRNADAAAGLTFTPLPMRQPLPATSVVQSMDGAFILGSLRGLVRIEPNAQK